MRLTDNERRALAEKIRQENVRKEKEMLEEANRQRAETAASAAESAQTPPAPATGAKKITKGGKAKKQTEKVSEGCV